MSSFVYFKFKSQKDPTRVTIDGPHTDVWNLKREIINISRLGDGSDFDLKIYKENSDEEYTDDTEIIPKDSTVLARRLPAAVPGKGRAARYVSGKPPASAKPTNTAAKSQYAAAMDSAMTEQERLNVTLQMTDAHWEQKQEEMAHENRVNIPGQKHPTKKANIPAGEPPHGYICFRCMKRGHWIQACPTNDDASFDKGIRIKKTTGIPRSMLQKLDQSDVDKLDEQQKQNVMVTSEGEYVLAQADKKTWQKFQDQKTANEQAKKNEEVGDKELQELGLECPIDKRMFVEPMKTPCCGKTYCHECIENALLDNDLECPGCHTANVSLERLEHDKDAEAKIKDVTAKKDEGSPQTNAASPKSDHGSSQSRPGSREGNASPGSPGSLAGRKRGASEITDNKESLAVPAPAMKRQKSGDSHPETPQSQLDVKSTSDANSNTNAEYQAVLQQMQSPNMPFMNNTGMGMPMFPNMMPFMPNMGMNMNANMMDPMAQMAMMQAMTGGMNSMNGMPSFTNMNGMPNFNMNGMAGTFNNMNNNTYSNGNHSQGHQQNQYGNQRGGFRNNKKFNNYQKNNSPAPQPAAGLENAPKGPKAMTTGPPPGVPTGPAATTKFANQQRHGSEEDNAYMRQPVNPQRAMNRDRGRKGMRNAEYKEL